MDQKTLTKKVGSLCRIRENYRYAIFPSEHHGMITNSAEQSAFTRNSMVLACASPEYRNIGSPINPAAGGL
ncbi:MAG: hypothetical protein KKH04_11945 [Proteobacteria bacterium]|nr:hypothetical protein [Pseudomonadota bacterium]